MSIEERLEERVEQVLQSESVETAGRFLGSRSGTVMISIISFIESALPVPILTDPFLVATILADRTKAVRLVIVTTLASVVGGVCAFLLAAFFFSFVEQWMTPGMTAEFQRLVSDEQSSTLVLTLIGAVTPIPYTIVAWVVAVLEGGLLLFIGASVIGRGTRYVIVGYATYRFGSQAVAYAKRYLMFTTMVVLALALLYVWYKM